MEANLKRTPDDLERLADVPGKVRLVTGADDEPEAIAYGDEARVDEAYRNCLAYVFEHFDGGVAVGRRTCCSRREQSSVGRGSYSFGSSSFDSALRRCSSSVVFEMSISSASSRVGTSRGHS